MFIDLNLIIVVSLVILTFITFCCFVVLLPIALQTSKTLSSLQSLIDTINNGVGPTVKEVKDSIYNVKDIVQRSTSKAKSTASKTGMLIVSSAYGILTGIKKYLSSYKTTENGYNNKMKEEVKR